MRMELFGLNHRPKVALSSIRIQMAVFKVTKCPVCRGVGKCLDGSVCETCRGTGEIPADKRVPDPPCRIKL